MVKAWKKYNTAYLFVLLDENQKVWHWAEDAAHDTYTGFSFQFEESPHFSKESEILFYPLQWTRICLSKDSNTSLGRLVIDQEVKVKNQPDNLNLDLGTYGTGGEHPRQTTNLNIFSFALTVEQMKLQKSAGKKCGLEGDFLSWEKSLEEGQ